MKVLAGTGRGVFCVGGGQADIVPRQMLQSRGIRDLSQHGSRLFAGTGAGLYVSDDLGESWRLAGLADFEVWQTRGSGDVLYATTQPAALFKSTDGGDTWDELPSLAAESEAAGWGIPLDPPVPGRARALVVDEADTQHLWVGVEVGGVMESRDGGETWVLALPGGNPDLHMMYAHPAEPTVLFASTGYGRLDGVAEMIEGNAGVFRSDDGGENWSYAWWGIEPRYSRPMCIDTRTPFALTVASAPNAFSSFKDADGAGAMLFRSEDRGASWRSLCDADHSPAAANIHGLNVDPEVPGGVLVGTDTGEAWRVSNDAVWTRIGQGMPAVLSIIGV